MIGGNERPCRTRVARITVKLIRIISARNGNGTPVLVATGNANAAARVTIPRMPVQEMRNRPDHGGMGSRARNFALNHRGMRAANGTHRSRTRIAVALTQAPAMSTGPNWPGGTESRNAPNCRPIRIKMTPFKIKIRRSHTARACNLVAGDTAPLND